MITDKDRETADKEFKAVMKINAPGYSSVYIREIRG
jgi:hypothetical protein